MVKAAIFGSIAVCMSDQAAKLREIVSKKNNSLLDKINMVSVVSGKGGVGKTTTIKELYDSFKKSFIVDCDVNSPYFWTQKGKYNFSEGFDDFQNKKIVKSVEKTNRLDKYDFVFVDAGTGLNSINKYYIEKSKIKIFVSSMEDISILNTMNLMKSISGIRVLFIPTATDEDILDMQGRVNRYSKLHLDNTYIMVCSQIEDVIKVLERNRI